ncbi:MAG: chromosome segregation protein SMC [Clostridiales bacterium]|nr:chromosome segregation protein SMC [Clostridiales bacterium]MDD6764881.1 chromosome segregation protein SMC [Bacillota bacterium]
MLFKKIEMHGFKSFAEPITIEFNEGLTGIVGPNGSGKSNISDAIRWVLGEQSPKMLRGGKMEEVIFNGTDTRKSRGMAEVTLVIDNSDESLPIDYKEVAITRRMYRSGESEYHINGNQCRLRDIRELIMDTGIGVDGYSIIGQGKIADIISNKTESRREIFEEAAGIVAYRTKKSEAERKLASTTQNMARVQDIIGEIEGRIDGLREDSIKAGEYLELKEKNKKLEINIILKNVESLENKQAYAREDLENITASLDKLKAEKNRLDVSIGEAGTRSEALEAVSVEARERLIEAIDLLNRAVNKGEVDRERLSAIESNTERINQEITQLLEKKERELENSEEFMKQKAELDERAREADLKLQEKVEEYNGLTGIMTRLAEEADNFRNSIFRLSTEITAGKSEISSMEMLRETLRKRQETLTRERDAGEDSNRETLDSLNGARGERDRLAEEMEAGREEALRLKQTMETRRREEKELAIQLEELKLSLGRMTARKKTIEELENNYEGYNHAVKHVMKSGLPGIHGVVAELIRVPEGYETAMETALGNSLQNIVCDDEDSARRAIVSLKENRAGRMTFLPLTSIRGRETPDAGIKNEKGVLGFGPECISCDSKYDSIISYLLGRVVLVDSMESAIRISRKYRGILVVTLDGEIINERGAITGGKFKNKTGNILDRRAEINQLGREIEDLNRKQSRALEKLEKVREEIGSLTDKASRLEESIRAGEHALLMKENEISMAENVLADLKNSGDKVNRELESISREQENSMRMIGEIRKSIAEKEAAIKKAESLCNEKLSLHEERKGEFNSLSEEITAARITVTAAQEQKSHAEEMMERINRELSDIEGDIARRRQQLESMEAEKRELTEGSTGIDGIISRQEAVKAEAEQRLEEVSGEKAALAGEISEMNAAREELNRKIQVLQDQKYDLDVRRAKNETQLESFKEKLWEDFEVSYIQAMEFKAEDFALSRAVKENRQIRNRIRELGEVNVGAIEEYQVVKERYEFLTGEREDVQKAMDDLNRIISEMDKTIKTRFRESFDRIVINFEKQFKELFGGGHAELRLSDENNPLESNIDIVAQPPGKKLQNINLLSGGEKTLTAIALMFAVLQAKPTPFCILDEVEAALDDANIDKFIHCLRKFDNVQFTLVTHQKATMEHADVLYGVTMPEKGISKVLSLSLEDDLSPYNG